MIQAKVVVVISQIFITLSARFARRPWWRVFLDDHISEREPRQIELPVAIQPAIQDTSLTAAIHLTQNNSTQVVCLVYFCQM